MTNTKLLKTSEKSVERTKGNPHKSVGVPRRVTILDSTFDVEFDDNLIVNDGALGRAKFRTGKITLQSPQQGVNQNSVKQCFWHEVVHCILHKISYHELNENEEFVDLVASCLNQVEKTWEV